MAQRIKVHTWRESQLIVFIDKICGIEEDVDNSSFILFDGQRQLIKEPVDEVLKLIDKATGEHDDGWHDLLEDPDDLPMTEDYVVILTECGFPYTAFFDKEHKTWIMTDGNGIFGVTKWKNID